jgi:hypothetical protein
MTRWLIIAACAIMLAGCYELRWGTSETVLRQTDFKPHEQLAGPPPIYCYRTLGDADCLAQPLPEPMRLIGAYAAQP